MTVLAGKMLVDEIVPRLKVAIPKAVPHIGCEDHEELIQDATVTAAEMLIRAHAQGKTPRQATLVLRHPPYKIRTAELRQQQSGCDGGWHPVEWTLRRSFHGRGTWVSTG